MKLRINGELYQLDDIDPAMPLLWALRDELGLTGTKYSCGVGNCGTCVVLMNGAPVRSCVLPVAAAAAAEITTIEGLSPDGTHPVQEAWIEEDVTQCGYCQGGQILTAVALLGRDPDPDDDTIRQAMAKNLCRCGTYPRIHKAIRTAARKKGQALARSPFPAATFSRLRGCPPPGSSSASPGGGRGLRLLRDRSAPTPLLR